MPNRAKTTQYDIPRWTVWDVPPSSELVDAAIEGLVLRGTSPTIYSTEALAALNGLVTAHDARIVVRADEENLKIAAGPMPEWPNRYDFPHGTGIGWGLMQAAPAIVVDARNGGIVGSRWKPPRSMKGTALLHEAHRRSPEGATFVLDAGKLFTMLVRGRVYRGRTYGAYGGAIGTMLREVRLAQVAMNTAPIATHGPLRLADMIDGLGAAIVVSPGHVIAIVRPPEAAPLLRTALAARHRSPPLTLGLRGDDEDPVWGRNALQRRLEAGLIQSFEAKDYPHSPARDGHPEWRICARFSDVDVEIRRITGATPRIELRGITGRLSGATGVRIQTTGEAYQGTRIITPLKARVEVTQGGIETLHSVLKALRHLDPTIPAHFLVNCGGAEDWWASWRRLTDAVTGVSEGPAYAGATALRLILSWARPLDIPGEDLMARWGGIFVSRAEEPVSATLRAAAAGRRDKSIAILRAALATAGCTEAEAVSILATLLKRAKSI